MSSLWYVKNKIKNINEKKEEEEGASVLGCVKNLYSIVLKTGK